MIAPLLLAFIKAHWQKLAVLAVAIGIFAGGRYSKSCPVCAPAVHLAEQTKSDAVKDTQRDTKTTAGPLHEVITEKFACPPTSAPAPVSVASASSADPISQRFSPMIQPPLLLERITTIDEGQTTIETKAATQQEKTQDTRLQLDVTPPPTVVMPRFSVFWQPQVKPGWQLGQIGGDVRLTDRVWLGAWVAPFESGVPTGATLRVSF